MSDTTEINALRKRYRDAYSVATVIVSFGSSIKIVGILVGVGIMLLAFQASAQMGVAGMLLGGVAGGIFYLLGILISAQGQILHAVLDTAVNSSPFLTNPDRAEIMSLRSAEPVNENETYTGLS
ncbi:MAG: hypothetical protein HY271_05115 [Deltaproteobacteria bacterium]|nr:hypothetical protein [Deltaproteobacteria bacterium]